LGTAALPVISSRQLRSCHASAAYASSLGPLIACVDACCWRAQQLLGPPDPSLPREGAFAGQAPGGYYRCSGYQGIPVHLLLGPFNGPASAQGQTKDQSPAKKTLMRRRPMRRRTTETAKDQKTSSRCVPCEGMDRIHVSSVRSSAEQEDKDERQRTAHAILTWGRLAPAMPA
jgi:hypothetical protein